MATGFHFGQWSKDNRVSEFMKFRDEHLHAVRKMSSECWEKTLEVNNRRVQVEAKLELAEKNVRYFQYLLEKEREKATKTATDANKEAMASVAEA